MHFYRQSDIVEIPELTWLLTCVTSKGLMNRAHAYKAASDANLAARRGHRRRHHDGPVQLPDPDGGRHPDVQRAPVPVGRDQVQHIEMARDIAQRFNHLFGNGRELFVLPEAVIDERIATLPGLDGRKMSKSYDNTDPAVRGRRERAEGGGRAHRHRLAPAGRAEGARRLARSSRSTTPSPMPAERAALRADLLAGLGWGDAKQRVVERIEREMGPMRARYAELMARPQQIEETCRKARARRGRSRRRSCAELREAVGLRPVHGGDGRVDRSTSRRDGRR